MKCSKRLSSVSYSGNFLFAWSGPPPPDFCADSMDTLLLYYFCQWQFWSFWVMCSPVLFEDVSGYTLIGYIWTTEKTHTNKKRQQYRVYHFINTHHKAISRVLYIYICMYICPLGVSIKRERHSLSSLTTTVMALTTSRLGTKCYHHHTRSPPLRNRQTGRGTHIFRHIRSFI